MRFKSLVEDVCVEQGQVKGVVLKGGERIACRSLVLAIGHSARDTFAMLHERKVPLEPKAFAVGLRVEHPQTMVNESQYGMRDPGELGAAPYKVRPRPKAAEACIPSAYVPEGMW